MCHYTAVWVHNNVKYVFKDVINRVEFESNRFSRLNVEVGRADQTLILYTFSHLKTLQIISTTAMLQSLQSFLCYCVAEGRIACDLVQPYLLPLSLIDIHPSNFPICFTQSFWSAFDVFIAGFKLFGFIFAVHKEASTSYTTT